MRAWLLRTACRWMRAPVPPDEEQRLAALQDLGLLDGLPDGRLDDLTRRAASLFDVPIALVTVVGREQQWIKSSCGLSELRQTSREASFCAHVIAEQAPIIVPDTLLDDRFAENPMVIGARRIRFYAGFPLRLPNGSYAGSLCLVDNRPRQLDSGGLRLLASLGEQVQRELGTPKGL
jgi:GAF domain-containing protein